MVVYWLLFGYVALAAMVSGGTVLHPLRRTGALFSIAGCVITAVIGLRYEVGGDWGNYQRMFSLAGYADLGTVIAKGDPGYQLLNWGVHRIGAEIWLVNLTCAIVFTWGLFRLLRTQPDPWLSLVIAVPYLIVVVAMGYTRQAIAIGIIMAGLAQLIQGGTVPKFAAYILVAALFHRTAVCALPLAALTGRRGAFVNVLAVVAFGFVIYDSLTASSIDVYVKNYLETEASSQGALIRIAQNVVPASLTLVKGRELFSDDAERKVWRNFSIAVFIGSIALVFSRSSTVVDRLSLYLLPLQMVVLPRLTYFATRPTVTRLFLTAYSAVVLFVWLNFANNAYMWIPYRFYDLLT